VCLTPPFRGFLFELGDTGWPEETRMMWLPGQEKCTISLAVWIQYANVTDGQTDGHRPTANTAFTHSVAR